MADAGWCSFNSQDIAWPNTATWGCSLPHGGAVIEQASRQLAGSLLAGTAWSSQADQQGFHHE